MPWPRLESALGAKGFEVRIAGAYDPPDHLRDALTRPSVTFLGHVEEADVEFALADALIVPTTIPLGTRVRIISAWSLLCPVVTHEANAAGIPVIIFDTDVDWPSKLSFVGANNRRAGRIAGEHLVKLLGGQGKVAVIRGISAKKMREPEGPRMVESLVFMQ